VDTTTSLAVTAGPIEQGKQVTLTATVTPSTAGGSVTFKDGTTTLGTAAVSGGKATFKTTTLPIGTASLTAAFAPATAADYNASTSAPSTLDVVAPPVIGGVSSGGKSLTSGATLTPGQSVTVTASGFQPDDSVEVDVHSATAKLATVHADASGKVTATVTLPASLAAGPHTLTLTGSVGSVSFAFTVSAPTVAPPTPGSGDLANTGSNVLGGTVLGGALASAGVLVLLASRRRHRGLHRAG
jgi:LPXTG-motif cell wall-anchored protein